MLQKYIVQPGDTLISIAEKVYGDPKAFTDIFRVNEDVIMNPDELQPGTELYIPPSAERIHREVHEAEATDACNKPTEQKRE
jgi:nucleoid-associated protein YgaU